MRSHLYVYIPHGGFLAVVRLALTLIWKDACREERYNIMKYTPIFIIYHMTIKIDMK